MMVYLVMQHVRDGSYGTTTEHEYEILNAFVKEESAIAYLKEYVKGEDDFVDESEKRDGTYFRRVDYDGSPIEGDTDYTELYIDEIEVIES